MASGGCAAALRRLASSFLERQGDAAPEAEVLDYLAQVLEDGDIDVDALVRSLLCARTRFSLRCAC
jgi:hypothetical protein